MRFIKPQIHRNTFMVLLEFCIYLFTIIIGQIALKLGWEVPWTYNPRIFFSYFHREHLDSLDHWGMLAACQHASRVTLGRGGVWQIINKKCSFHVYLYFVAYGNPINIREPLISRDSSALNSRN